MKVRENISLKSLNTFGIDIAAKRLWVLENEVDFTEAIQQAKQYSSANELPLVLGGGSNILFTQFYDGNVFHPRNTGIEVINDTDNHIEVAVAAGENWHEFVLKTVEKGWCGIENLSLIPGAVGATPVQNIGAYGVEVQETITAVEAYHLQSGKYKRFSNKECNFSYRNSIFKSELKGQYIISKVHFKLSKQPEFNTSYGAISAMLEGKELTQKNISDAVIAIRSAKLPDPKTIGNCGSFFKNPIVETQVFERLKLEYPNVVAFPVGNKVKLAAGWLIDQAGWKGKTVGNVGTYEKQALVMINRGGATGNEAKAFAQKIQEVVLTKFGVQLEPEVNII